jgi:hypothetical protein
MSDFLDPSSLKVVPLDEKGKKEQARLRKELRWDENGKKIESPEPEKPPVAPAAEPVVA